MSRRLAQLAPGEYFVGSAGYRVRTLLGSCVSITLWHPLLRVGAMSHFLLAERPARQGTGNPPDARYGTEALQLMMAGLARRGAPPSECEAKVFGGAHMFPSQARSWPHQVGQRNGDAALELLEAEGIPIVSSCLYGHGHRIVIFDIESGDVWARQASMASDQPRRTGPAPLALQEEP